MPSEGLTGLNARAVIGTYQDEDTLFGEVIPLPLPKTAPDEVTARPESVILGTDREVIPTLLKVHAVPDPLILDCCFGSGIMWKGLRPPAVSMDLDPRSAGCIRGDFARMPFRSASFDVIAFDPPHLPNAYATNDRVSGHKDVYGVRVKAATRAGDHVGGQFEPFLREAQRVLRKDGIVLGKIADLVHNHRYQFQHVDFITAAREAGLTPCDVVIKRDPRSGNLSSSRWQQVHHVRRVHLFWIVLRKGRCERRP